RQILERNVASGHFSARRQHATVRADDLDGRRAFWNFERLDRRQMRADIDHHADDGDGPPQSEHGAPVEQPGQADARPLLRPPFAISIGRRLALARSVTPWTRGLARCGASGRLVVGNRDAIERIEAQLRKRSGKSAKYRLLASAALFSSPHHTQQRSRRSRGTLAFPV